MVVTASRSSSKGDIPAYAFVIVGVHSMASSIAEQERGHGVDSSKNSSAVYFHVFSSTCLVVKLRR